MKLTRLQELSGITESIIVEATDNVFADALNYNTQFSIANRNNPSQLRKFKLRMTKLGLKMHDAVGAAEVLAKIKEDFPIEINEARGLLSTPSDPDFKKWNDLEDEMLEASYTLHMNYKKSPEYVQGDYKKQEWNIALHAIKDKLFDLENYDQVRSEFNEWRKKYIN